MVGASCLTDKERLELRAILRRVRGEALALRRANILLLLDKGWTCEQVAEAFFLERTTIEAVQRVYKASGISSLYAADILGRPRQLYAGQRAELALHLASAHYATSQEVRDYITRPIGLVTVGPGSSPS